MEITGNKNATNGIRKTEANYWLSYPDTSHSNNIYCVYDDGRIASGFNFCYGIRPMVWLNGGVYIASGDGTEASPYVLGKE